MAENEVSTVEIGRLYYPRAVQGLNGGTAQRVGPTRFSLARTSLVDAKKLFADSKGIGHWYPAEIAEHFRPAPDVGSTWRPRGGGYYIPRIVRSVDETAIRTDRGTFLPGTFLDTFEPDTYPIAFPAALPWPTPSWFREPDRYDALAFAVGWGKFPAIHWSARHTGPIANRVKSDRADLLKAIDEYAARDSADDFTEALDLNDTIQAVIEAHSARPKCADVESARTALELAIEVYDALPSENGGGIEHAAPVVVAVDALIAACRAAR